MELINGMMADDGMIFLVNNISPPPVPATPIILPITLECIPSAGLENVLNNVAWYSFTLASTTTLTFDTEGSVGDTMLGVYDDTGALLGYDDDSGSGYLSSLTLNNLAPNTYYIATGYYYIDFGPSNWNAVGDSELVDDCALKLNVSITPPPPNTAPLQFEIDSSLESNIWFQLFGNTNVLIDWGDGNIDQVLGDYPNSPTHTYSSSAIYTANITGQANGFRLNYAAPIKLLDWGNLVGFDTLSNAFSFANLANVPNYLPANVTTFESIFYNGNITDSNIGLWDTSNVIDMNYAFMGSTFNLDIGNWNTGNVTFMRSMFANTTVFNQSLNNWNTSNVITMDSMFYNATAFNQSLNNWNTGNVTNMKEMFSNASNFNGNISNWNTSNVANMYSMFYNATAFNQPLDNWNTGNVANMREMFSGASSFNQPLNNWNTSNVTNMNFMFSTASNFNGNISNWNTSNVANMYSMFYDSSFNQPINNWDVGNVTHMNFMFYSTPFNQPLNNWNTSNVTDMYGIFYSATAFNQNINTWDTSSVTSMDYMFRSATAFNQPLDNWNTGNVTSMDYMFYSATVFNQNISGWCVTNIPTQPVIFSQLSALTAGNKPVWGTCPP